jgi:two-component system, LytTR family, sensor kinase
VALVLIWAYALMSTFNFSLMVSLADAINLKLLIVTASFSVFKGLRYYQPSNSKIFYLFIWCLGLAALCEYLHTLLMPRLFPGETEYLTFLAQSHLIRGLVLWMMITLTAVSAWTWYYVLDQRDNEKREQDALKLAREAELASLRQQLQPHFLFNSLNSISALAGTRPEEARKMIQQLSDFLRGTIRRDDQQLVTLDEELKHLELYLDIEKVRFGHRLKTELDKDDVCLTLKLPSLLLQPIVENAIKFGLYDTTGEIVIRIRARSEEGSLILTVENPFDPATAQPRAGTGFGLTAVQRRLYLLYARNDLLTTRQLEQENPLFITQVRIPQTA